MSDEEIYANVEEFKEMKTIEPSIEIGVEEIPWVTSRIIGERNELNDEVVKLVRQVTTDLIEIKETSE